MIQVRRVTPRFGAAKTSRPDVRAKVSPETLRARKAVVVPLFPQDGPAEDALLGLSKNIFADLGSDRPTDARVSRARLRARRQMPMAEIPSVENIFDDNCPDVSEDIIETQLTAFRSRRRKMDAARAEIFAAHEEKAHIAVGNLLHDPWQRAAAGVFGMLSLLQISGSGF